MSQADQKQLWDGMRALVARLRAGRYWTERRDAGLELGRIARQAAFRLQQAARDRDPDVAHWGAQAHAELKNLLAETNEDFARKIDEELAHGGLDPDQPPAVLAAPSAAEPAALSTPESLITWLETFAAQQDGAFSRRASGATITLNVADGRRQTLQLDLGHKDSTGESLALFYSICGDAKPEHFLWALQANSQLSGGAFAVIQRNERHVLIMLMRRRLAELTESWLRSRLTYLAQKADWAESRLQPQDEH